MHLNYGREYTSGGFQEGRMIQTGDIRSLQFSQKKRNSLLYKADSTEGPVFLKCTPSADSAAWEAFHDEYEVMKDLTHPGIPLYYGLFTDYRLPDLDQPVLALCMQDCSAIEDKSYRNLSVNSGYSRDSLSFSSIGGRMDQDRPIDSECSRLLSPYSLRLDQTLDLLDRLSQILSWLLDHGVLYTDLNPTNLIIRSCEDGLSVFLVDYTCSYYFLKNPYPAYDLRFSYDLSPDLKGQQLLIQEMSFLLEDLTENIEDYRNRPLPSPVYSLIETGRHPGSHLSLSDYQGMIGKTRSSLMTPGS